MTRRGLVIAWMPTCQRCRTLGEALDYDVELLGRSGFRQPWSAPLAYPGLALKTIGLIVRRRPSSVVVIAPPFLLPYLVLPLARAVGASVAIDVHSGALLDRRWRWSVPFLRLMLRLADASMVTLQSLVPLLGGGVRNPLVLPDPLPRLQVSEAAAAPVGATQGGPRVVAAAGWGADEPLAELAAAADGAAWQLAITGRQRWPLETPPNVRVTGFLDAADYVATLASADVVVALSTRDQTLLSGAWEAIALRRPLVLSGTPSLRATFAGAAVFVEPDRDSIRAGIDEALSRSSELERSAAELAGRLEAESSVTVARLRSLLSARRSERR